MGEIFGKMKKKYGYFYRYWQDDQKMEIVKKEADGFRFEKHIDSLANFEGTHPSVMLEKIKRDNLVFDYDTRRRKYSFRVKILSLVESLTGWRIGEYKNCKIIE